MPVGERVCEVPICNEAADRTEPLPPLKTARESEPAADQAPGKRGRIRGSGRSILFLYPDHTGWYDAAIGQEQGARDHLIRLPRKGHTINPAPDEYKDAWPRPRLYDGVVEGFL